jgi:2,4-dienoyl-CoA reductase (NADPH2)
MSVSPLFAPFTVDRLQLANRITMAPMYTGYAAGDGSVTELMLEHYREMAGSGVSMVVVENVAVHETGLAAPNVLRGDGDGYIDGLRRLAATIKECGAAAFAQINHGGRFSTRPSPLAPSPVPFGGTEPVEMRREDIETAIQAYAETARRIRAAGFDGVEIHGGTGYLPAQFLSPRTNRRQDEYGGGLESRMRFPLRVHDTVREAVGLDYPVGYRFMADELMPDGFGLQEAATFARELDSRRVAYLSVTVGTYESFMREEYQRWQKREAYMAEYAGEVKRAVPDTPVIAAGRIQSPEAAEQVLTEGKADLIGLARVLFSDPLWPRKARGEVEEGIAACEPSCNLCMDRVMHGKPIICSQWPRDRRQSFLVQLGEGREQAQE